ncbi:MAG: basic secretory protein-like protein [Thermoguttaceae bacterium]
MKINLNNYQSQFEKGTKTAMIYPRRIKTKNHFPLICLYSAVLLSVTSQSFGQQNAADTSAVLPDTMTVTITKTGAEKAKINVTNGDEAWETVEGKWSVLPEPAQVYAKSLLRKIPELQVEIDCSDSPNSAQWAETGAKIAKEWFPKLVELMDGDDFEPNSSMKIVIKKMDGVAYASGNTVTISENWITQHPEDLGMVVHELIHLVQAYHGRRIPGWVTEGIADYIRFFIYEPGNVGVKVNPDRNKYTDSYRITACFFDWIVKNKDPKFITKLNDICRRGEYSRENTFQTLLGKDVDALWEEYTNSLRETVKP